MDESKTLALLSVEEVARRLDTPVRFVRRLIAERRITFHKVGRYVRISTTDLDAFDAAGRIDQADQNHRAPTSPVAQDGAWSAR